MLQKKSRTIQSVAEYRYCPVCGAKTEHQERPITPPIEIGGMEVAAKTNLEVKCPEHGELIHR